MMGIGMEITLIVSLTLVCITLWRDCLLGHSDGA